MCVIDVGCGTGDLVRFLTSKGAKVKGVDSADLIEKAKSIPAVGDEEYLIGIAQNMEFEENYADLIIFFASFHHIPENDMDFVISKCHYILKPNGHLVFLEPFEQKNSYYELTRLVEDESEIQMKAYNHILSACKNGFSSVNESFYFVERSFQDFKNLIDIYVKNVDERRKIIEKVLEIVSKKGGTTETVRFPSYARLNIIKKSTFH
jgi:ubiquinone/menaquinone biosynthesis C-methylase UbiE